jgi:cobalt/nickel transport system permease protein
MGVAAGFVFVLALAGWALIWSIATSTGGWVGIDAGIMERVAEEAGRPAWTPFVNTDTGDLLLLVFATGALVSGSVMGWLARGLSRSRRRLGSPLTLLLVALLPCAALLGALITGFVGTGSLREAAGALFHPLRGQVLSANGGDFALFLFMLAGLCAGLALGWGARDRRARRSPAGVAGGAGGPRLRLIRLPHLHAHDARGGDRLAWEGRGLSRVDARVKLAFGLLLLVVNLLAGWAFSLGLFALGLVALFALQRVRGGLVLLRLAPGLMVAAMLVLLRGFTEPGRTLLALAPPFFAPVRLTLQGMGHGAELGLVVLAGITVVVVLGVSTPLPSLLAALRWMRMPALLIEIGLLMYRYLFLIAEEAGRLRQAQRLRGPEVPWSRAMGGFSRLGAILLIRSFERSQRIYDAQRLRGGGGAPIPKGYRLQVQKSEGRP